MYEIWGKYLIKTDDNRWYSKIKGDKWSRGENEERREKNGNIKNIKEGNFVLELKMVGKVISDDKIDGQDNKSGKERKK